MTIHYRRADGAYDGWGLHLWGDGIAAGRWAPRGPSPRPYDGIDDFGAFWRRAARLGRHRGRRAGQLHHPQRRRARTPDPDQSLVPKDQPAAWHVSGDTVVHPTRGAALGLATIHYHRPDGDYGDQSPTDFEDFWGLHVWAGAPQPEPSGRRPCGRRARTPSASSSRSRWRPMRPALSHIIHRGDEPRTPVRTCRSTSSPTATRCGCRGRRPGAAVRSCPSSPPAARPGDLAEQRAHWVSADTISGRPPTTRRRATACTTIPTAAWRSPTSGISGESIRAHARRRADPAIVGQVPAPRRPPGAAHPGRPGRAGGRAGCAARSPSSATDVDRGAASTPPGCRSRACSTTCYANDADLGVTWDGDVPTLRVWAPTAKSRRRCNCSPTAIRRARRPMLDDDARPGDRRVVGHRRRDVGRSLLPVRRRGVRAVGRRRRAQRRHRPVLAVAVDELGSARRSSTSPIPASRRRVGRRAQAASCRPPRTCRSTSCTSATSRSPTTTVPAALRGTFGAFTVDDSDGMEHLGALADAGLGARPPAAGVRLRHRRRGPALRQEPDPALLATFPPGLRAAAGARRGDPRPRRVQLGLRPVALHRARGQLRHRPRRARRASSSSARWSQALNETGLRVVMDVVYNHTTAAGQDAEVGARPGRARLLPPAQRRRRHRDVDVLPEHGQRARHDGEAADRLRRDVGARLQGRRLPLRPDGPPLQGQHARTCAPRSTS